MSIDMGRPSDMSYIFENGLLSWIVTGPVNEPTRTAYSLFVWGASSLGLI